ncbi:DSBA oxidoreductase [Stachybotrys elegans]|uniref:DSBA oxidoreductase n=1 Tax=Stachybotrys elegans TaxID=80388 RepID=A0A8K0WMK9_9HYPO|nr:DSBA oxidoreductase [Stachybotrys elegans]
MTNFDISVVSDTVCPWCYVGYRQLEQAQKLWRQRHPADTFSVRYLPYQLNPEAPRGVSVDKQDFYAARFGAQRFAMMNQRLGLVGASLGIDFKFGGRTGNTFDSHRVIHLAQRLGGDMGLRTVEGLFEAYFEKERDITDLEVLRQVALAGGVPEEEFQKSIVESNGESAQVEKAIMEARRQGVSGVPDFTIQDRYRLGGAQSAEEFIEIFEKIKALGD